MMVVFEIINATDLLIQVIIIQLCFVEYKYRAKRVQISHDICTRLNPPTARQIKNLGKSEFWGNENVG